MNSNVANINRHKKVQGLWPILHEAETVEPGGCHLQCGHCGFNGRVKFYVESDAPWCFEALCNCPLEGVLTA